MDFRKFVFSTALAAACFALPANAQESTDPIKLTLHDWTGQLITTEMMGEVLKKAGYNVEYVQADYLAQFAGLETGDLTVAMEIWATTGQEALDASVATGNVENLGETGMQAKEEWWYPLYMKEKCPGLPNWEALKDPKCAAAFATPETAPKGRYLGGPVTWEGFDDERAFRIAQSAMYALPCVEAPLGRAVVDSAVDLFRGARRAGVTVRSGTDCLIAACAVRHGFIVAHCDRD